MNIDLDKEQPISENYFSLAQLLVGDVFSTKTKTERLSMNGQDRRLYYFLKTPHARQVSWETNAVSLFNGEHKYFNDGWKLYKVEIKAKEVL